MPKPPARRATDLTTAAPSPPLFPTHSPTTRACARASSRSRSSASLSARCSSASSARPSPTRSSGPCEFGGGCRVGGAARPLRPFRFLVGPSFPLTPARQPPIPTLAASTALPWPPPSTRPPTSRAVSLLLFLFALGARLKKKRMPSHSLSHPCAKTHTGHLNPAVTISSLLCGFYPLVHSVLYIIL